MIPLRSPAKMAMSAPSHSPGPLTTQPITATLIGRRDFLGQLLADILHELEEIDLDSAAGRAGDQLGADARAQAQDVEQFQAVLHFVDRIVGVADADGVADAAAEQMAQRNDASGWCRFPWARRGSRPDAAG